MVEYKNNECKEDPLLKSIKLNYIFYSLLIVCLFIISYYTNSSFLWSIITFIYVFIPSNPLQPVKRVSIANILLISIISQIFKIFIFLKLYDLFSNILLNLDNKYFRNHYFIYNKNKNRYIHNNHK